MENKYNIKEQGYLYLYYLPKLKGHILLSPPTDDHYRFFELWVANKNHASYGLIYKNTHLEFVRNVHIEELWMFKEDINKFFKGK